MPTIIMDSCNYTRLGLSDYMSLKGVKKKNISSVSDIEQLQQKCEQLNPGVVLLMKIVSFMNPIPVNVSAALLRSILIRCSLYSWRLAISILRNISTFVRT